MRPNPRRRRAEKHELAYLISRAQANRDDMQAEATERKAFLAFNQAFRDRDAVSHEQFVAELETSLRLFEAGPEQARSAATEYAQIIDYPSDLEALYHLNVSTVLGLDLVRQWMHDVANFQEGKPYTSHVPWERLYTEAVQFTQ